MAGLLSEEREGKITSQLLMHGASPQQRLQAAEEVGRTSRFGWWSVCICVVSGAAVGDTHPIGPPLKNMAGNAAKRGRKSIEEWASQLQNIQEQEALDRIMEELKSRPEKIMPCLNLVMGNVLLRRQQKNENEEAKIPATYTKLALVPKAFQKQVIASIDYRFSSCVFDLLEKADRGAVNKLFHFSMATQSNYPLPTCLHTKSVCIQALTGWSRNISPEESSSRLHSVRWSMEPVSQGKIEWNTCGVYTLMPPDVDVKTHVKHISGGQVQGWS